MCRDLLPGLTFVVLLPKHSKGAFWSGPALHALFRRLSWRAAGVAQADRQAGWSDPRSLRSCPVSPSLQNEEDQLTLRRLSVATSHAIAEVDVAETVRAAAQKVRGGRPG